MSKIVGYMYDLDTRRAIEDIQDPESILRTARRPDICPQCLTPRSVRHPKSVPLYFLKRPRGLFQPAAIANAFRRDVFDQLRPYLRGRVVGPCFLLTRGKFELLADFVSCYTKHSESPIVRGGPKSRYAKCGTCGAISKQFTDGDSYLVESEVKNRFACQTGVRLGIYLSKELKARLDWSSIKDVRLTKIPIRDVALDDPLEDHCTVDHSGPWMFPRIEVRMK